MSLRIEWVDDPVRWRELGPVLEDVLLASDAPSIFASFDFLDACWTHFAEPAGNRLAVLVAWDGDQVAGYAPFRITARRPPLVGLRRLGPLAHWNADRPAPVTLPGRERDCAAAWAHSFDERAHLWDILDWREAPEDAPLVASLRSWAEEDATLRHWTEERSPSAVVQLEGLDSWDAYLATRSSKGRGKLRSYLRALAKRGPYEHETFSSVEDIPRALELFTELEKRSWKAGDEQGISRNERNTRFYRELALRLARKGRVEIAFLSQGGERLAATFVARLAGTTYGLQTAYDQRFASLSVGTVMRSLSVQREIELGTRHYDMLGLFPETKRRWTDTFLPTIRLVVRQLRSSRQKLAAGLSDLRRQPRPASSVATAR